MARTGTRVKWIKECSYYSSHLISFDLISTDLILSELSGSECAVT